MVRRLPVLIAAALVTMLLVGCGGGGLLGALLGLIAVGDVVGDLSDLMGGEDPHELDVYLDGQLLPVHPDAGGVLRLRGLPEGQHLLQAIASSRYRGAIVLIDVEPNADLRLGALQSQVGGRIRGTVMVESAQGSELPASRVAVYAIPGGAQAVAAGGPIIDLPPEGTHYVSFTDGAGQFSLDALAPGDYLVTAAVAGCATDAQLVAQLGERQTVSGVDLTLAAGGESTGTVRGTVRGQIGGGTQSLPGAIVRAELTVRLAPTVPEETIDRIAAQAGTPLRPSPWFRWQVLSTLTDAGGSYTLSLPVGTGRITCFTYDYRPAYQDVTISTGADTHASFTLQAR